MVVAGSWLGGVEMGLYGFGGWRSRTSLCG